MSSHSVTSQRTASARSSPPSSSASACELVLRAGGEDDAVAGLRGGAGGGGADAGGGSGDEEDGVVGHGSTVPRALALRAVGSDSVGPDARTEEPGNARRIRLAVATALAAVARPCRPRSRAGADAPGAGLLPDLQTVVPTHLQIVNQQQRDYLRFSNGIANTGAGPLALRPENVGDITNGIQEIRDASGNVVREHLASQYEFHPAHNHWHLGDVALFEVRRGSPTGPVVSGNSIKVTFCLIDWYQARGQHERRRRAGSSTARPATRASRPAGSTSTTTRSRVSGST